MARRTARPDDPVRGDRAVGQADQGGSRVQGLLPFHNEKTPSFTVNDEKGFYHCFGCGAHGDAIRFLTDHRGLPFMDAVKELAGKAGMDVPAPGPRDRERQERSAGLYDVMAAAQRWFAEQLNGVDGGEARYLAGRGIDARTIERFGSASLPTRQAEGRAEQPRRGQAGRSGMLIRPEEDGKDSYDRSAAGSCSRFATPADGSSPSAGSLGRASPIPQLPDTPLFDKGRTLYNIDRAAPASRQARRLIVVEGYMDVIALDRAGIAEAVAPNGTAVTEAQLERMWRLDGQPICFDGDAAGQKAAVRAALRALPHLAPERTLRFVALPSGQDPDDLVRTGGKDAVEALLAAPSPGRTALAPRSRGRAPRHARGPRRPQAAPHRAHPGDRRPQRPPALPRRMAAPLRRPRPPAAAAGHSRSLYPRREWKTKGRLWAVGGRALPNRKLPRPAPAPSARSALKADGQGPAPGLHPLPRGAARPCRGAGPPAHRRQGQRLARDQLVQIAMAGQHLDRDALQPYWPTGRRARMSGAVRCGFHTQLAASRKSR